MYKSSVDISITLSTKEMSFFVYMQPWCNHASCRGPSLKLIRVLTTSPIYICSGCVLKIIHHVMHDPSCLPCMHSFGVNEIYLKTMASILRIYSKIYTRLCDCLVNTTNYALYMYVFACIKYIAKVYIDSTYWRETRTRQRNRISLYIQMTVKNVNIDA